MKINGSQIITGMYAYNPSYEFTVNDFVIKEGVIYVCIKDVTGEDPETSDSFQVYLGDKGVSFPECLDFLEDKQGANKYLTVGMLQAVMSHYMLGPTGKGVIGDYICYDSEGLRVSPKEGKTGKFSDPETIISDIMFHPEINHALLRVSRFLPEINGYVGSQEATDYVGEDKKSVLLRQYTYLQEGTGNRIRLQELIDPVDGVIWYRSGNLDTTSTMASGVWKCSVVNSRALKSKVEGIIGIYTSRLKVLRSLETHLKSNFRFKKLSIPSKATKIEVPGELEVTLTVSKRDDITGFLKTYQTSIDLENKDDNGGYPSYLVGEGYKIEISGEKDHLILSLTDILTGETPEGIWFSDTFYKEYYGLS